MQVLGGNACVRVWHRFDAMASRRSALLASSAASWICSGVMSAVAVLSELMSAECEHLFGGTFDKIWLLFSPRWRVAIYMFSESKGISSKRSEWSVI